MLPYALEPTTFRFPALAALAGRSPLGGHREVALATYVVARLAHDSLPARGLSEPARIERASSARHWLANLALPAGVRPALVAVVESTNGSAAALAQAIRSVIAVTASYLDGNARSELTQLAAVLDAQALVR